MGKQDDFTFTQMQPCTHIYLQVVGIHTCSTMPALTTTNHLSLSFSFTPQLIRCGNNGYRSGIFSIILPIAWQKKYSRQKRKEPESYYCQQFADSAGMDGLSKERGPESKRQTEKHVSSGLKDILGRKKNGFTFSQKQVPLNSFRVILLKLWASF